MKLLTSLTNDRFILFILVAIFISVVMYIYTNRKCVLIKATLVVVTEAQEAWGSDMGRVKFAEAYTILKTRFPVLTFFMSESALTEIIEEALYKLKEMLISKAELLASKGVAVKDMSEIIQSILEQTGEIERFTDNDSEV